VSDELNKGWVSNTSMSPLEAAPDDKSKVILPFALVLLHLAA